MLRKERAVADASAAERQHFSPLLRTHAALMGAACLLALTIPVRAQVEAEGVISGRVTDWRGHPQQLMVRLLAQGDVLVQESYTDSNGGFAFRALPNGEYYVLVETSEYRPFRQSVMLDNRLDPKAQVNIQLEPKSAGPNPPTQVIGGSGSSHKLNAKRLGREFDKKALREFEKGNSDQSRGNLQSAAKHYRKALDMEPELYPALNNLGAILLRQKDATGAEKLFLRSVELDPQDGEAYINLGHMLYQQTKYPDAVARLQEGLKRSPQSPLGHFLLGSALMKLGDFADAEPNLKAAAALDPGGMSSAHLQLANLYLRRHEMSAAGSELENYLRSNPSDPQAPAIKKLLANIRTNHPY